VDLSPVQFHVLNRTIRTKRDAKYTFHARMEVE
jgi:hypothetical protein